MLQRAGCALLIRRPGPGEVQSLQSHDWKGLPRGLLSLAVVSLYAVDGTFACYGIGPREWVPAPPAAMCEVALSEAGKVWSGCRPKR